jgi:tRNA pseudouridine55 synthase
MIAITKKTASDYEPDFQTGEIILLDKAVRKSSFDLVYKVRKATGVQKVGHAGTLDPIATGLVVVCTGRKTKVISHIQELAKTYTGVISLGKTTSSHDSETEVISEKSFDNVTEKEIFSARDLFIGKISQTPPMYSAVKIHGQPLYKYARKGVELERKTREVSIYDFEIKKIEMPDIYFEINCSKGTYIRVIANDLGKVLGCGAYLKKLRRTHIGDFDVEDAFEIEEFKEFVKKFSVVLNTD